MRINLLRSFMILELVWLSSCIPAAVIATPSPLPATQSRPNFVLDTLPKESQILHLSEFEITGEPIELVDNWETVTAFSSQICIKIDNYAQVGDDFSDSFEIVDRVTLQVDDKPVDEIGATGVTLEAIRVLDSNGQVLMEGIGPKLICGKVNLQTGNHEVFFQFRQTTGNLLQYQWVFELIE